MPDTATTHVRVNHSPTWDGALWLIGWLFTLGYLHLPFWRAVLGLIIWPYYLGVAVAGR